MRHALLRNHKLYESLHPYSYLESIAKEKKMSEVDVTVHDMIK
jgi:hypothetical protein